MEKIIIGTDAYGLIKKHSEINVKIKITDSILKAKTEKNIGFMDLLPI